MPHIEGHTQVGKFILTFAFILETVSRSFTFEIEQPILSRVNKQQPIGFLFQQQYCL